MSLSSSASGSGEHKVAAVTDGSLDYALFVYSPSLPVVDEASMLEQCGDDWEFVVEILQDVMNERAARVAELQAALQAGQHTDFHKAAHAIKGVALNLHLPALVDVSKKAELLGKQLLVSPADRRLLDSRAPLIAALHTEYARLELYIQTAKERADAAGGGEDGDDSAMATEAATAGDELPEDDGPAFPQNGSRG